MASNVDSDQLDLGLQGSIAQSIVHLTADPGVAGLNPSLATFVDIDHETISMIH